MGSGNESVIANWIYPIWEDYPTRLSHPSSSLFIYSVYSPQQTQQIVNAVLNEVKAQKHRKTKRATERLCASSKVADTSSSTETKKKTKSRICY